MTKKELEQEHHFIQTGLSVGKSQAHASLSIEYAIDILEGLQKGPGGSIYNLPARIGNRIEELQAFLTGRIDEDKTEPLYVEKDLADFAQYCGEQFQYIDGYWRDDPDPRKWTIDELLKLYLDTRIPSNI